MRYVWQPFHLLILLCKSLAFVSSPLKLLRPTSLPVALSNAEGHFEQAPSSAPTPISSESIPRSFYGEHMRSNTSERFAGVGRLYSSPSTSPDEVLGRLQQATVIVVGLGGVGSWAAESLCRSGVGGLVLVDLDDICVSNVNRQIHATSETVGQLKLTVMKQRLQQINPKCRVELVHDFVSLENIPILLDSHVIGNHYGIVAMIDAIDACREKAGLVNYCHQHRLPVVTVGGAAGLTDPTRIVCQDLTTVDNDRLLACTRRDLRAHFQFPPGIKISQSKRKGVVAKWNVQAVSSDEPVKEIAVADKPTSSFRRCDSAMGTACFVTAAFGFVAASSIVDQIARDKVLYPTLHQSS